MMATIENILTWDLCKIAESFTQLKEKTVLKKANFCNTVVVRILPGGDIPAHYEDYNTFFYVLKGTGTIQIGTQMIPVQDGTLVFSPREQLRGIFPKESLLILGIQEPH